MADSDGRYLLNMAEQIFTLHGDEILDPAGLAESLQKRAPLYDKGQEEHYNLISALHKSMRGSDRSEEHTSELQSLMRISYAVLCLKKKTQQETTSTAQKIDQRQYDEE